MTCRQAIRRKRGRRFIGRWGQSDPGMVCLDTPDRTMSITVDDKSLCLCCYVKGW